MPRATFTLEHSQGAWRILLNGEGIGRFADRPAALACIVEMAELTRRDGVSVEVLVENPDSGPLPLTLVA